MALAKILLVDDSAEVRMLAARILTNQGYELLEASDGENALAACAGVAGKIDLLLTDIRMPGMDGVELAETLTASYPTLRVLFISGEFEESEIQQQVIERGFGFLSKPFMPQLLIQAVKQMLLDPDKRPYRGAV